MFGSPAAGGIALAVFLLRLLSKHQWLHWLMHLQLKWEIKYYLKISKFKIRIKRHFRFKFKLKLEVSSISVDQDEYFHSFSFLFPPFFSSLLFISFGFFLTFALPFLFLTLGHLFHKVHKENGYSSIVACPDLQSFNAPPLINNQGLPLLATLSRFDNTIASPAYPSPSIIYCFLSPRLTG